MPIPLHPDSGSGLSDGVVVETHLLARLLGIRLLRVDGVVLLSPARLDDRLDDGVSGSPPGRWPQEQGDGYAGLVEAARLLEETEVTLRACRSEGDGRASR